MVLKDIKNFMNIEPKTYSKIKTFVNLRYLSMGFADLIFKMLSYFAYSYIMVLVIAFQIFMMEPIPFEGFSLFDERIVPFLISATVLSCIMSGVTVFIYHYKTKWSVILNSAITYFYVSVVLFLISCFISFEVTVFNVVYLIIKIAIYILCYFIYLKYLFDKKLPKIEEIVHNGQPFPAGLLAGALAVAVKPVISLLGLDGSVVSVAFNNLIALGEYLMAICIIVNMVDAFVKAYYAKIYNIN